MFNLIVMGFVIFTVSRFILHFIELTVIIEWVVFRVNSLMIEVFIMLDWLSSLFMGLVLMITSIVVKSDYRGRRL
jgi:hypothetical protein